MNSGRIEVLRERLGLAQADFPAWMDEWFERAHSKSKEGARFDYLINSGTWSSSGPMIESLKFTYTLVGW